MRAEVLLQENGQITELGHLQHENRRQLLRQVLSHCLVKDGTLLCMRSFFSSQFSFPPLGSVESETYRSRLFSVSSCISANMGAARYLFWPSHLGSARSIGHAPPVRCCALMQRFTDPAGGRQTNQRTPGEPTSFNHLRGISICHVVACFGCR